MRVLLGVLVWSAYHYVGHRIWHAWMRRGVRGGPIAKEAQHHDCYDAPAHPDEAHIGFPWELWACTGALGLLIVFGWGALTGLLVTIGMYAGMAVDDQLHRRMHRGTLRWPWFVRWHTRHHATHDGNYAMATGVIWDWLGGTARW